MGSKPIRASVVLHRSIRWDSVHRLRLQGRNEPTEWNAYSSHERCLMGEFINVRCRVRRGMFRVRPQGVLGSGCQQEQGASADAQKHERSSGACAHALWARQSRRGLEKELLQSVELSARSGSRSRSLSQAPCLPIETTQNIECFCMGPSMPRQHVVIERTKDTGCCCRCCAVM